MRTKRKDLFEGKVAIVTGGASGMGRAVAERLARRGARVVIADLRGAKAAAEEVHGGSPVRARATDVRDARQVEELVEETVREHGRLDYMFNNAGVGLVGAARDMTLEDWARILDVDLHGVVHGVQAAYPRMVRQGFGHIVNTASIMGLTPSPLSVAYAAAKHAVVGLSTSLRSEGASAGVKVSVVCPGFIDTPMKDANHYLRVDKDEALRTNPFRLYPVEGAAEDILAGVERNRAYIVLTPEARWMWRLHRASPHLYGLLSDLAFQAASRKLARTRGVP